MAYESRHLRRQKIRYNNANDDVPIRYQCVVGGEKKTPDSAPTIDVYPPGSTTALVSAQAMTLSGTVATYSIDTTTVASWPVETGYRAHVTTTVSSVTYEDDLIFDVCKFILWLDVSRDQLVARDERMSAMAHDGDEDFSEAIEAARDEMQLSIESKVINEGRLLENMVLDKSRVSVAARPLILANIFEEKADFDQADRYRARYDELWRMVLSSISYDANQDLSEDGSLGGVQAFRLVY